MTIKQEIFLKLHVLNLYENKNFPILTIKFTVGYR